LPNIFGVRLRNSFIIELLHFRFSLTAVHFMQNSALQFDCDQLGA
jgi:hypothetical protein